MFLKDQSKIQARYNAVRISYREEIKINVHSYEQFSQPCTQERWKNVAKSRQLRACFYKAPDCKTELREDLLQGLCTHNTSPSHAYQFGWLYIKPFLHKTL